MKKSIFTSLLASAALCTFANTPVGGIITNGNINYKAINGTDVEICGYTNIWGGELNIPSTVADKDGDSYNVVAINATTQWNQFTAINFTEDSQIKTICDGAFYGSQNVKEIKLPESVKEIGKQAFFQSKNAQSIYVNATSIGAEAFANCYEATTIVIGKNVETIGDKAFSESQQLVDLIVACPTPPACGTNVFYNAGGGNLRDNRTDVNGNSGGNTIGTNYYLPVVELEKIANLQEKTIQRACFVPSSEAKYALEVDKNPSSERYAQALWQWDSETNAMTYYAHKVNADGTLDEKVYKIVANYDTEINTVIDGEKVTFDKYHRAYVKPNGMLAAAINPLVYKTSFAKHPGYNQGRFDVVHVYLTAAAYTDNDNLSEINDTEAFNALLKSFVEYNGDGQAWDKEFITGNYKQEPGGRTQRNFIYIAADNNVNKKYPELRPALPSAVAGSSSVHNASFEKDDEQMVLLNGTDLQWSHENVPTGFVAYDKIVFLDADGNEVPGEGFDYRNYGDNTSIFATVPTVTDEATGKVSPKYPNWKVVTTLVPEDANVNDEVGNLDASKLNSVADAKKIESEPIAVAYAPTVPAIESLSSVSTSNTDVKKGNYEHTLTWVINGNDEAIASLSQFIIIEKDEETGKEERTYLDMDHVEKEETAEGVFTFTANVQLTGGSTIRGSITHTFSVEPMYLAYEATKVLDAYDIINPTGGFGAAGDDNNEELSAGTKTAQTNFTFLGIDEIEAAEGEAEFFSISGVKMNSNELPAGIYVKKTGNKTVKVIVK